MNSKRIMGSIAPWLFVFLWSSGFVAAKYIHPAAEPFTFLTIRYSLATLVLVAIAIVQRKKWDLSWSKVRNAAVVGFFLHFLYIGGVFYAVSVGVNSGVTSAIISLQPIVVSLVAIPVLGERFRFIEAVGLFLGIAGIGLLLLPKIFQGDFSMDFTWLGIGACVVGLAGTALGYILQKKTGSDMDFVTWTALQYGVTALLFAPLSLFAEDHQVDVTFQFLAGLAWVVFALSIGSIFLLFTLLKQGSAGSVSSLYYLVPPSSAIQAYFLFGETISPVGIFGMALAGLGVMLVMRATASGDH